MFSSQQLRLSRRLSTVPRWSVVPTLRPQNVAEHSYHVAQLVRWLLTVHRQGDDDNFCMRCILMALDHDSDEGIKGDAPGPSKTRVLPSADTPQERIVLKCADTLEMVWFAREEKAMGNVHNMVWVHNDAYHLFECHWKWFSQTKAADNLSARRVVELATLQTYSPCYAHPAMEKTDDI